MTTNSLYNLCWTFVNHHHFFIANRYKKKANCVNFVGESFLYQKFSGILLVNPIRRNLIRGKHA